MPWIRITAILWALNNIYLYGPLGGNRTPIVPLGRAFSESIELQGVNFPRCNIFYNFARYFSRNSGSWEWFGVGRSSSLNHPMSSNLSGSPIFTFLGSIKTLKSKPIQCVG